MWILTGRYISISLVKLERKTCLNIAMFYVLKGTIDLDLMHQICRKRFPGKLYKVFDDRMMSMPEYQMH